MTDYIKDMGYHLTVERVAVNAAHYRAKIRKKVPVVFKCIIDLTRFPHFWNPNPGIYVFNTRLPPEVISKVIRFDDVEELASAG